LTRLTTARKLESEWKGAKIDNTGDTKGHKGPRYRQETIDANRTDSIDARVDDGGMKRWESVRGRKCKLSGGRKEGM
jgi:hypothetical protein